MLNHKESIARQNGTAIATKPLSHPFSCFNPIRYQTFPKVIPKS
jgi:hypothetical protein